MATFFKNSKMVVLVALFVVGAFLYRMILGGGGAAVETQSANEIGSDLVKLSDDLSKAQLSQTIFTDSAYRSLTDFTVPVPQDNLGRTNPFDILGRD